METIQITHIGKKADQIYNSLKHSIRSAESSIEFFKARLNGMETGNKMRLMQSIRELENKLKENKKHIERAITHRQIAWN